MSISEQTKLDLEIIVVGSWYNVWYRNITWKFKTWWSQSWWSTSERIIFRSSNITIEIQIHAFFMGYLGDLFFIFFFHLLSCVWLFVIPWTAACQASLSFTTSWSLLKLTSIELVMLSNHLILCCPLLLLPSIFPNIRVFSNEPALRIRWPEYLGDKIFKKLSFCARTKHLMKIVRRMIYSYRSILSKQSRSDIDVF